MLVQIDKEDLELHFTDETEDDMKKLIDILIKQGKNFSATFHEEKCVGYIEGNWNVVIGNKKGDE